MSEEKKPSLLSKMNLKDATNKVSAEALRQFQIEAEGKVAFLNLGYPHFSLLGYDFIRFRKVS